MRVPGPRRVEQAGSEKRCDTAEEETPDRTGFQMTGRLEPSERAERDEGEIRDVPADSMVGVQP